MWAVTVVRPEWIVEIRPSCLQPNQQTSNSHVSIEIRIRNKPRQGVQSMVILFLLCRDCNIIETRRREAQTLFFPTLLFSFAPSSRHQHHHWLLAKFTINNIKQRHACIALRIPENVHWQWYWTRKSMNAGRGAVQLRVGRPQSCNRNNWNFTVWITLSLCLCGGSTIHSNCRFLRIEPQSTCNGERQTWCV